MRTHRRKLIHAARREGVIEEDALDCVQDALHTFLHLPQARVLAEEDADAGALLTVLTRNAARNRRRRHDRARPHEPLVDEQAGSDPPVDELIAAAEAHAAALGCAVHLSEVQRRIVTLRLLEDVPGENVAALLRLSPGNVAVLLHRAKQSLRTCMESVGYRAE